MLVVDAGNLLFKSSLRGAEADKTTALITAHGIVQAYQEMAYDAVAIGASDLSAGTEFFRRTGDMTFPWVAANIYDHSANRFFPPHIVKKWENLTVGIIGLTGNDGEDYDGFVIGDWRTALETEIAVLEKNCDMLVVLSSLHSLDNTALQREFKQVDIIVTADRTGGNIQPRHSTDSLIVQSGARGKYMGKLEISGDAAGSWRGASTQATDRKHRLDAIDRKLSHLEQQGETGIMDVARKIARLRAYRQTLSVQLARQPVETAEKAGGKSFEFSLPPVYPSASGGDVDTIVQNIKGSINGYNISRRAGLPTGSPALHLALQKEDIAGTTGCLACHAKQAEFWTKTRHAQAYTTLLRQGQSFNLQCLPCHVTSGRIGTASEESERLFLLALDTDRQTIGCEVCHSPGKQHLQSPEEHPPVRLPPEKICTQCHTPERDNNFNYQKKLAMIACPAD